MATPDNRPTSLLMQAFSYRKDNRLLPEGFQFDHPNIEDMRPVGVDADPDFVAGSDTVEYRLPFNGTAATVQVSLLYQTLGSRFAAEIFTTRTPEVEFFEMLYNGADVRPVVVGQQRADVF